MTELLIFEPLGFFHRVVQWYHRAVCKISKRLSNWNGCYRRTRFREICQRLRWVSEGIGIVLRIGLLGEVLLTGVEGPSPRDFIIRSSKLNSIVASAMVPRSCAEGWWVSASSSRVMSSECQAPVRPWAIGPLFVVRSWTRRVRGLVGKATWWGHVTSGGRWTGAKDRTCKRQHRVKHRTLHYTYRGWDKVAGNFQTTFKFIFWNKKIVWLK